MVWGSKQVRRAARLGRAGVAVGLSAALVTTLAMPADAKPKYPSKNEVEQAKGEAENSADQAAAMQRKLTAEQTKLDQLDQEVEIAVEAYNGAVYRLGQAKQAYTSAKKRAKKSQAAVEEARSEVAAIASNAYASRGVSQYVTLFGSEDPAAVANGAGALHALSQQQGGAFDKYRAAKIVHDLVQKQSASALKKQRKQTKQVAEAKRAAEAKLASQQQTLERVASLSSKLAERAAADEGAATNAAAERREGIAEARRIAAEKAAEARKRARAAAKAAQEAKQEAK